MRVYKPVFHLVNTLIEVLTSLSERSSS